MENDEEINYLQNILNNHERIDENVVNKVSKAQVAYHVCARARACMITIIVYKHD